MTVRHYVEAITHYECGRTTSRSVPGVFGSRPDAFAAAVDFGQSVAGPERPDHRRPTVAVVTDEMLGMCVKVGDADVDASYTIVYVWSIGAAAEVADVA